MVETFEIIMFSYDVKGSFDTQNKNDDDDDDDDAKCGTLGRKDGFTMFAEICLSTLIGFGPV